DQARRELRRSRQLGRIDEASLEYTTEWERLFHGAIDVALAAGRPDKAHESVCDGKAGLIGDLHFRLRGHQVNEPAEVLRTRLALTDWMRNCLPVAPRSESPSAAELEQFAQKVKTFFIGREDRTRAYISTWGQHHHAYIADREHPLIGDTPSLAAIQACLPCD